MKTVWWSGHAALLGAAAAAALSLAGCAAEVARGDSYFERRIQPIFDGGCVRLVNPCHGPDARGESLGNLDLSSYDALMRRRDALSPFGSYPLGLLLMKVTGTHEITVEGTPPIGMDPADFSVMVQTDVRHAAGIGLGFPSASFLELRSWIESGFTRTGLPREEDLGEIGPCTPEFGFNNFEGNLFGAFRAAALPPDREAARQASFERFRAEVQPLLVSHCAGSRCHGSPLRGLQLACGDDEEQQWWNYFMATWFLSEPLDRSELLRRALGARSGGSPHVSGVQPVEDADFGALFDWADDLAARDPDAIADLDRAFVTDGYLYFIRRVQPVLVRKGCMFEGCHSVVAQNQDVQLFGGSRGRFSRASLHRNHGTARAFLALWSDDPNQSRIIAKNLFPPDEVEGGAGLAHRGGPILEDLGAPARPELCAEYDVDGGDVNEIPAYCILARWHAIERGEAIAAREVQADPPSGVLWVDRPAGVGEVTDFDTHRPGADLRFAGLGVGADGWVALDASRSLLDDCAGLAAARDAGTLDVRGPSVAWNAARIAFAARTSESEPLRLWWMDEDGLACEPIPGLRSHPGGEPLADEENGILVHDLDPTFSPTGQVVFASTRGHLARDGYTYQGPTRTPAAMQPNANIYVREAAGRLRQLTFLLGQELHPHFTAEGRVVYTIEKRHPGFHQIALRRMNLDGGDFRPFFASRDTVGFTSASEMTQLPNLDAAFVAAPLHAPDGVGAIAFANPSLGADQHDRDPSDRFYLRPLRIPRPGVLAGGRGVFRSPSALPSGRVLASCDLDATLADAPFDLDLCELDAQTGQARVMLAAAPGRALLEPVAIVQRYVRPAQAVLESDGETLDRPLVRRDSGEAEVIFHDFPMQVSLEFVNTRTPHAIDRRIRGFDVLEHLPPPAGATRLSEIDDGRVVTDEHGSLYAAYRRLGHVVIEPDGSAALRVPPGTPLLFRPTDEAGEPLRFTGDTGYPYFDVLAGLPMMPREADQYYPGEQARRGVVRSMFNPICGFCHAAMSGRELPVATDPDVLSAASRSLAAGTAPIDLDVAPADRAPPE